MSYIFKICVNVTDEEQIIEIISSLDDYLCLGKIIPNDPFGLCLGVIRFEIDGEIVKLALWTVNEHVDRPWVRLGGTEINYSSVTFEQDLYNTAQQLKLAAT